MARGPHHGPGSKPNPTPPPIDLNAAPTFPPRTLPDQDGKPRYVVAVTACRPVVSNISPGRNVVILADNDDEGRNHADKNAALIVPTAASVRVVHFDDVPKKGDVANWIEAGHTADDLQARVDVTPLWTPPADETESEAGSESGGRKNNRICFRVEA